MPEPKPTRILLVSEHVMVREGLIALLSRQADFDVCVGVGTTGEAETILRVGGIDVVLLDPTLQGAAVLALVPSWRERFPRVRILLLVANLPPAPIRRALDAGAAGCVSKSDPSSELFSAIRRSAMHNEVFSPAARRLLASDPDRSESGLTKRETEILRLIAAGSPTRDIARSLGISAKTIDRHKENLKDKLGLPTSIDLARHAFHLFPDEEK